MTKEEAIKLCKQLWKEIEESGMTKLEFLDSRQGLWYKNEHWNSDCPLCEWAIQQTSEPKTWEKRCEKRCEICPLPPCGNPTRRCFNWGYHQGVIPSAKWLQVIKNLPEPALKPNVTLEWHKAENHWHICIGNIIVAQVTSTHFNVSESWLDHEGYKLGSW